MEVISIILLIWLLLELFGEPLMRGKNKYEGKHALLFDVVDWADFILMILVILSQLVSSGADYFLSSISLFENHPEIMDVIRWIVAYNPLQGAALYAASLILCLTGVWTTIGMWKKRQLNLFGLLYNVIIWGIWIPLDGWFLINALLAN
jgi:hypothetical protein